MLIWLAKDELGKELVNVRDQAASYVTRRQLSETRVDEKEQKRADMCHECFLCNLLLCKRFKRKATFTAVVSCKQVLLAFQRRAFSPFLCSNPALGVKIYAAMDWPLSSMRARFNRLCEQSVNICSWLYFGSFQVKIGGNGGERTCTRTAKCEWALDKD